MTYFIALGSTLLFIGAIVAFVSLPYLAAYTAKFIAKKLNTSSPSDAEIIAFATVWGLYFFGIIFVLFPLVLMGKI